MHGVFFSLFSSFWWLLFPLGWALAQLIRFWSRQRQAEKAMEIIRSYTDQGKEPPAEIIKLLQPPERNHAMMVNQQRDRARGLMMASFIFVALAVAFAVLTVSRLHDADADNHAGLLFVTVLMGGFAVAFFTAAMLQNRDAKQNDSLGKDGT